MDLLCDYVVVEILLRLPLKYLHRLRAVSRRYNALVLRPDFATRYWRSHGPHLSGVFLQTEYLIRPWGHRPSFLGAPGRRLSSVLASDFGFIPKKQSGSGRFAEDESMVFIVHSACGLLLCCRGRERQTQYYVCNPVTWQCVALPVLPCPHDRYQCRSGLLTLAGDAYGNVTSFQVVLINHLEQWRKRGGAMDLKVFSSETGEWQAMQLKPPSLDARGASYFYPTFLGNSGTVYWIGTGIGDQREDRPIAYNSFYNRVQLFPAMPKPTTTYEHNRCLGERYGGGGLRYAHFDNSAFEVWDLLSDVQAAGGARWRLVHRVDVMELAEMNEEATSFLMRELGVSHEGVTNLMKRNDLFHVLGFHPTDEDIVYFDAARSVAAYSMGRREITLQSPRQCYESDLFPYVHPPHPVLIPEIKNTNSKLAPPSELLELNHS
ncbi:unnamed protein product [Urochloa humidicola]